MSAQSLTEIGCEQLDLSHVRDKDIEAIACLEEQLFGAGAWSKSAVEMELSAPDRTYFVVRENESQTIIAYAGFWFDGYDAQIMTIGVAKDFQGHHIAARLMEEMKNAALRCGAERILLEVAVNNEPALALYKKFGFVRIGLRKRYYQPEDVDAYTMKCVLPQTSSVAKKNPVGFSIK